LRCAASSCPAPCPPRVGCGTGKAWNEAEGRETNKDKRAKTKEKANARPARDVMFSYPFAMSAEGRFDTAMKIARHLADNHLILVDFAIHKPGRKGDQRNFHCHMLLSSRRVTAKGFGEKAREFDDRRAGPVLMKQLRAFIAQTQNDRLKFEGKADQVHVEHRSFRARGSAQVPTRHLGQPGRVQSKQRVRATRAWTAAHSQYQKERHAKELAALKLRQDFALQGKLASLAQSGRDGEAAIRGKFAEQRRADPDSTGMRRLFQIVTGREGRAAFDQLAREAQRTAAENAQVQGLKREVQAARNEFVTGQQQERAALIERHGIEDRQLSQTAASREFADRSAARSDRQRQPKERTNEQERQRGPDRGREPSP
jgi:MobA/MobL family